MRLIGIGRAVMAGRLVLGLVGFGFGVFLRAAMGFSSQSSERKRLPGTMFPEGKEPVMAARR